MRNKSILIFLGICLSLFCYGQSGKLFTADRELSSSLINKIYQDKKGIIWIATEDGLNRYDGAKFTIYKHVQGDDYSLSHNYVRTLFEDSKGRLFVGTYKGLQMYDPATDRFSLRAVMENGQPFNSNVGMLLERRNGDLWVSGNILCTLTIKEDKLIIKNLSLPIPTAMTGNLMEDKEGNIWLSVGENGLYCLTTDNKRHHYLIHGKGIPITDICQDDRGYIYVGSLGNGLYMYDKEKDSLLPVPYKGQYDLPIKTLYPGSQGELYIGTDGEGLKSL